MHGRNQPTNQSVFAMCNIVTKRFIDCIEKLRETTGIKSNRQFAISLDYLPQNFNDIMKSKRDVTIDLIKKAAEIFKINPTYIFTGEGFMLMDDEEAGHAAAHEHHKSFERIVYVPTAVHAGYVEQFRDPVFLEDLVSFSLPDYKFQHGQFRCFDITGDSMEPSLFAGDKVVCSQVDGNNLYSAIRNNHVYVVVTDNALVIKRVINRIRERKTIELISDNTYYEPFEIPAEEIREVWHVQVKISPYLHSPNNLRNAFHEEMDEMKSTIEHQSKSIQMLNQTLEKLLRQNRAVV